MNVTDGTIFRGAFLNAYFTFRYFPCETFSSWPVSHQRRMMRSAVRGLMPRAMAVSV